ncbi:MAG: cell filamentation protein Fic [Deltaproteobacteria bacterium RIFOXYD12_FULL_57_12]|nr:MAG: cell filamentation protein Fic [Deltaproteobacteria bacterium RIFOXYD12_FULL_57_12]
MYIWEHSDWPRWQFDLTQLAQPLASVRYQQGRLLGRMESLGFRLREEALLTTLTLDVVKTSEIEGERLDPAQVRSSIARRLGMDIGVLTPADRHVEGMVEMMLDATGRHAQPLTAERLFAWHGALFLTGRSGLVKIRVAAWRDDATGPMQVVSGPLGREKIHYTAPPAGRIDAEMAAFIKWFNDPDLVDATVKAGIAHLWFVTLHPFDDGNGRIARAIADMALARSEGTAQRSYSMSAQIRQERAAYYAMLESTQKGSLDITGWLAWFLGCLNRAIDAAQHDLSSVLAKANFWNRLGEISLTERQKKVLNRLLDGFKGKLTTSKWARLAGCSQDTAYRDILVLIEKGILRKSDSGGRSTCYELVLSAAEDRYF